MKNSVFLLCVLLCACSSTEVIEPTKVSKERSPAMVVTANPLASQAGIDVLAAGGSAVDAAVAIEAVLSLVEPQSSGLAGGGFMMHFDNATKTLVAYDGRETAPASAQADRFLENGEKMSYLNAKHSGLSSGVPGAVAMLNMAHQDHGKLAWSDLFDAAKTHAKDGFKVSPRLHGMIQRFGKYLPKEPSEGPVEAWQYFHDEQGQPLAVGTLLKNPAYAESLDLIAADPINFYSGKLAQEIVDEIAIAPRAGDMTLQDLVDYQPVRRTALCSPYRGMQVCGPPPPSSWLAVGMIMSMIEKAPASSMQGAADPANWALFGEAQRLAYADRDRYVGDADQVIVPVAGLLNQNYLAQRASEISRSKAQLSVKHGDPWAFNNTVPGSAGVDATEDVAGTTHFVVVDHDGDVVSMTASVESIFGSARMVGGMFLNNQLTDFSFFPVDDAGEPIANAVAPGKRPRSSMSPTIVLDKNGEFKMATGSPGGNSIIAYTAKTMMGVFEWGLTPQQAVSLPNLVARGDTVRIEKDRASPDLVQGLRDYGFQVKESAGENSGLSVVLRQSDGSLLGGVDPRREGTIEVLD